MVQSQTLSTPYPPPNFELSHFKSHHKQDKLHKKLDVYGNISLEVGGCITTNKMKVYRNKYQPGLEYFGVFSGFGSLQLEESTGSQTKILLQKASPEYTQHPQNPLPLLPLMIGNHWINLANAGSGSLNWS